MEGRRPSLVQPEPPPRRFRPSSEVASGAVAVAGFTRAVHALISTLVIDGGEVYGVGGYGQLRKAGSVSDPG